MFNKHSVWHEIGLSFCLSLAQSFERWTDIGKFNQTLQSHLRNYGYFHFEMKTFFCCSKGEFHRIEYACIQLKAETNIKNEKHKLTLITQSLNEVSQKNLAHRSKHSFQLNRSELKSWYRTECCVCKCKISKLVIYIFLNLSLTHAHYAVRTQTVFPEQRPTN